MDEIIERLKGLTDPELRNEGVKVGVKIGPINATTRKLLVKRVAKKLFESEGGNIEETVEENIPKEITHEKKNESDGKFYAVRIEGYHSNGEIFGNKTDCDKFLKANKSKQPRFASFCNHTSAKLWLDKSINTPIKPRKPFLYQGLVQIVKRRRIMKKNLLIKFLKRSHNMSGIK